MSDRVREAIEEAEALRSKLRAAEREKVALEKERDESRRDLRLAEKRAEECMQRLEEEMRRLPKTAGQMSSHGDHEELKKLRDKIRDLETENADLKGELNCFDPVCKVKAGGKWRVTGRCRRSSTRSKTSSTTITR